MEPEIQSKYQRKTLEIKEFNLDYQCDCKTCDKPFLIDLSACRTVWDDDEQDERVIIHCPYCGQVHRILF